MIFTALAYKTSAHNQRFAMQVVGDSFEDVRKKLLNLYGDDLISIIYETKKNLDTTEVQVETSSVQSN